MFAFLPMFSFTMFSDSHLSIDGPLPTEDSTAIQVFDASTTANSVLYASEYVNGQC